MSDTWLQLLRDPDPWTPPRPLPGPVTTKRLIVRRYERDDGPALFASVSAERASLLPWMAWAYTDHKHEADSVYFVERARRAALEPGCNEFPMAIFDRGSGAMVGGTGLMRIRRELREAEIGYWIGGSHRGRGLATEAAGGLLSSALRKSREGGWGLRRVVVYVATANRPSIQVCQRLGLRLEMRTKQERYLGAVGSHPPRGYYDMLGYAVLASEWDFDKHRAQPGIAWDALQP
ncbi:GNAT family N-acetyltransferase [Haliangium ochraceum]|uniref:GCN5-related N-acetyltransferase n=1 Tax=Haliangium ochraceum (strain DSM 14365 / JCM 11303 / SMP-2) TaxID=502025 RepID=D0LH34_HALO1|nr:GNAT family protein [Haliangium ochraceum]ACY18179.1 GCN5-related N-acetyltransferase [Haliangium ochraceum DSM 14365]